MQAHTIEGVAENEKVAELGEIKWLHAHMVARAKHGFARAIPQRKREVAHQVIETLRAPGGIGVQEQFRFRSHARNFVPGAFQFGQQFRARVQSRVGNDKEPSIELRRLMRGRGFARGAQHGATQSHVCVRPGVQPVGSAIGEESRQLLEQAGIHGRSVAMKDTDDAAHGACVSIEFMDAFKGTK
jgi:hypothetical protein